MEKGVDPPCATCRVELLAENEEAAKVYMDCRYQFAHTVEKQPIDISIPAIESSMRIHKVADMESCLPKVRRLFHHFLSMGGDE